MKDGILIFSALLGYSIFLIQPLTLSWMAISESINIFTPIILMIDIALVVPIVFFLKRKNWARMLLGIYSTIIFVLLALSPIVQHKVDLTVKLYSLYALYFFLFGYIIFIMFRFKGTDSYIINKTKDI